MGFCSAFCACFERLKAGRGAGSARSDHADDALDSFDLFFDLHALQIATSFFSDLNKLGHGGFGPVYKFFCLHSSFIGGTVPSVLQMVMGLMPNGQEIAVKKLSVDSRQGAREFTNEVKLLLRVQHKNLVMLLGCCVEGPEKMLVYE
ncbi:cysteine-rich receptor-like protein kinase 10 isoform X2 [Prunus yedoensis var. nudiflora]|uniref:Cysteine-rich receptor-like protein kinase 10 isoform X2 n=1 Tax=Prunus yedoensis var. nudiflora TaxID=2094558 RepID=A0A314YXM1_PRUYE|nr:cysteine-rich receptor-like protein kinase 10 isoform X2 [Prunus yedoensis var. nudiflora]